MKVCVRQSERILGRSPGELPQGGRRDLSLLLPSSVSHCPQPRTDSLLWMCVRAEQLELTAHQQCVAEYNRLIKLSDGGLYKKSFFTVCLHLKLE